MFRPTADGWRIDSVYRPTEMPVAAPLSDEAVRAGVRSFIDELACETRRHYDYDVRALLRRVRDGPPR